MAGFLQEQQKQNIKDIIDNIHLTFARPITVFKIGQKTSIATSSNYNKIYKTNAQAAAPELVSNSREILARIKYEKYQSRQFFQEGNQEPISLQEGLIYIKVDADGYEYMKGAKFVEVDGRAFSIEGDGQPQGMFGPQYYKFTLTPT